MSSSGPSDQRAKLLREMKEAGERDASGTLKKDTGSVVLQEMGVSHSQPHRWQKLSHIS